MDNTKSKILAAAIDIFVSKGFSGASISEIAGKAGINQSLIYHHIGNKQALWIEVKKNLIGEFGNANIVYESLKHFLEDIIEHRIKIYEQDSRILRLIQWQMLEDDNDLTGVSNTGPSAWINIISQLQKKGEIRLDYSADSIAVYIHSIVNGVITDPFNIISKNKNKKKQYIKMIHKELYITLKYKHKN